MKAERCSKRTPSDTEIKPIESGFVCHIQCELLWTDQPLHPTKYSQYGLRAET